MLETCPANQRTHLTMHDLSTTRSPDLAIDVDLDVALAAALDQNAFYRPTSFWKDAALRIADELRDGGFEHFRQLQTPLWFFVPTYGTPGNGFSTDVRERVRRAAGDDPRRALAIDRFLSGHDDSFADFRVIEATDDDTMAPRLKTFSESGIGNPVEQFTFDGRRFSRSSLSYLLGLTFLKRHLKSGEIRNVLEIGGGFGSLGEILASGEDPGIRYIGLDIPPVGIVAQYYLSTVFGVDKVASFARTAGHDVLEIDDLPPLATLCNWQIENLRGTVDLFVNFVSFQEMEPAVVENYLQQVARLNTRWVLLRNLREGKQRKTADFVGVEQPILSDDYLTMLPDYELVDRNVVPFGQLKIDGYHSELLLLRRRGTRD